MNKRVIYDFGANNGCNLPYYLTKCDLVIAVEANPALAEDIGLRFNREISSGQLVIEHCAITAEATSSRVDFYRHKTIDKLSQFPRPDNVEEFEKIEVASVNVVDLIKQHGAPYYVKCDVERYDEPILRSMFLNGIKPPFISAESHSSDVFCAMLALGGYRSFNLIDGRTVSQKYGFPRHSAGPFGHDIADSWMTPDNFFKYLALEGMGWKDIHATTEISPNRNAHARIRTYVFADIRRRLTG